MAKCMVHWNGNQACAIDCETTGLDPYVHEIIQICILPLDSNINIRKDVPPFYLELKPENIECISQEAMKVNKLDILKIMKTGHDRFAAIDLFEHWVNKLDLPYTRGGRRKRITPLGHNYAFDMAFIKRWLGHYTYEEYFDYHYKDTMLTAAFMNDHRAFEGKPVPFSKINLSYLANNLEVPHDELKYHDALEDCKITARVYKSLCQYGYWV